MNLPDILTTGNCGNLCGQKKLSLQFYPVYTSKHSLFYSSRFYHYIVNGLILKYFASISVTILITVFTILLLSPTGLSRLKTSTLIKVLLSLLTCYTQHNSLTCLLFSWNKVVRKFSSCFKKEVNISKHSNLTMVQADNRLLEMVSRETWSQLHSPKIKNDQGNHRKGVDNLQ